MRVLAVVTAVLAAALASGKEHKDVSALVHKHREHRLACKAGDAAKCNTAPRHAQHVKDADSSPNQWNTPVLSPPTTHRDRRHVRVRHADGSHHFFAHIGQGRNFTGATPHGFLHHYSEVMIRNTTIFSEDFMPEFKASRITCEALMAADGSPADEHTQPFHLLDEAGLIRNPVRMTMTVRPGRAEKSGFLDLFRERFVFNNSIVFGGNVFIEHPDFAVGKSCGVQIPFDSPFYLIAGASWSGADSNSGAVDNVLDLALVPTTYQDLHLAVNVDHKYNPDIEAALAERTAAGLPLGDLSALPAYNTRRRLVSYTKEGAVAANWNGESGAKAAAKTASIPIIPDFLSCEGCYAFLSATVNLNIQFCFEMGFVSGLSASYYFYDSAIAAKGKTDMTSFNGYTKAGDTYNVPTATESADCNSLGMKIPPFSLYNFQAGFSIEAFITGTAGFSYNIVQKPFTGTTSTCPLAEPKGTAPFTDDKTAEACAFTIVPWLTSPVSISLAAAGVPISMTINARLRAAAQITGEYDGAISFGRTWSAGTTAKPFKLGALVSAPALMNTVGGSSSGPAAFTIGLASDKPLPTIAITPYTDFPQTNVLLPTKILAPTILAVKPEAYIYIDTRLDVWGTVPVVAFARAHLIAEFLAATGAAASAAAAGKASEGTSVALGYKSGSDTTALDLGADKCPATSNNVKQMFGSVSLGIDVSAGLLSAVTLFAITPISTPLGAVADTLACGVTVTCKPNLETFMKGIKVADAFLIPYFNILGTAKGIKMFAACVSVSSTSRRLGEARDLQTKNTCPASGCVYTFDDTKTYSAAQAAGTGGTTGTTGASDTPCTSAAGTAISQAACTTLQAAIPAGSGISPSSVCTCSSGSSSSALSGGAIAGIVIGVLAGVALIAVGGLYYAGKLPIGGGGGGNGRKNLTKQPGGSSAVKPVGSADNQNPLATRK